MNLLEITSISDPRISEFVKLKNNTTPKDHFVAESEKVVFKLLNSKIKTVKIFTSKNYIEKLKGLNLNKDLDVFFAAPEVFTEIIGINLHQSILALAAIPTFSSITNLKTPILILNAIDKAENVGALIRSSTAFAFNSVIFDNQSCSPYNRRSVRVSMGNLFACEVAFSNNLVADIQSLQKSGVQVVSAANESGAYNIAEFNFKKECAVIIGNEGHGISKEILKSSSAVVKIEINPHVAHINASHAGAIFFYEYSKRF